MDETQHATTMSLSNALRTLDCIARHRQSPLDSAINVVLTHFRDEAVAALRGAPAAQVVHDDLRVPEARARSPVYAGTRLSERLAEIRLHPDLLGDTIGTFIKIAPSELSALINEAIAVAQRVEDSPMREIHAATRQLAIIDIEEGDSDSWAVEGRLVRLLQVTGALTHG